MYPITMIKALAAVVLAASPALAELAVTAPLASTTCTGGQVCVVTWADNHTGVSLAQQGNCTIALYIGNAQQQTFLQPIAYPNSVNVTQVQTVSFTVDPTVGANNDQYFIRFSSTSLNQATSPTNPYLSFSAKFKLTSMTGTFNATVQQQLAGVSSSGGIYTSTSSGTAAPTSSGTTTRASTSTTTSRPNAGFYSASAGAASMLVAGAAFVVALF